MSQGSVFGREFGSAKSKLGMFAKEVGILHRSPTIANAKAAYRSNQLAFLALYSLYVSRAPTRTETETFIQGSYGCIGGLMRAKEAVPGRSGQNYGGMLDNIGWRIRVIRCIQENGLEQADQMLEAIIEGS